MTDEIYTTKRPQICDIMPWGATVFKRMNYAEMWYYFHKEKDSAIFSSKRKTKLELRQKEDKM